MQEQFSNWYASMSFQQDVSLIGQRWAAIQSYVAEASNDQLELLARLAFRLKVQMASGEVGALRQALAGDMTPPGDEELVMLAASSLAAAMASENDELEAIAATVVASISCCSLRKPQQPMDLVGQSNNVLRRLSETSRRRPSLEQEKFLTPKVDEANAALVQALSESSLQNTVQTLLKLTNQAISKVVSRQREFERAVQQYVCIQDEELDILWWLHGGHCFDLKQDFSEAEQRHLPLAIAQELATLTKVLPGPPALSSLFSRTGLLQAPSQSIPEAVQGMPIDWLNQTAQRIGANLASPALTPILFAIQRRHEVEGSDDWIAAWSTTTGLARDAQLLPLDLATATYREFSLVQLG